MLKKMEPHGRSPWYLHLFGGIRRSIPSYAQGFGGLSSSHSFVAIGRGLLRRRIKRTMVGERIERSLVERELKRLVIDQQEDMVRMDLYHLHSFKDVPLRGDHAIDHGKTLRGVLRPDDPRQS